MGRPLTASSLGQPLNLLFPLQVAPGEVVSPECVRAEVTAGENLLSSNAVRWQVEGDGQRITGVRLRTTQSIDEPVVSVQLSIGCPSVLTRQYTAFIDPPGHNTEPLIDSGRQAVAITSPALQAAQQGAPRGGTAVGGGAGVDASAGNASGTGTGSSSTPATAAGSSRRDAAAGTSDTAPSARSNAASAPPRRARAERPARRPTTATAPAQDNRSTEPTARLALDPPEVLATPAPAVLAAEAAASAASAAKAAEQRAAALERQLAEMQAQQRRTQAMLEQLRLELQAAREQSSGNASSGWLLGLGLLSLALAASSFLLWRSNAARKREASEQESWLTPSRMDPSITGPAALGPDAPSGGTSPIDARAAGAGQAGNARSGFGAGVGGSGGAAGTAGAGVGAGVRSVAYPSGAAAAAAGAAAASAARNNDQLTQPAQRYGGDPSQPPTAPVPFAPLSAPAPAASTGPTPSTIPMPLASSAPPTGARSAPAPRPYNAASAAADDALDALARLDAMDSLSLTLDDDSEEETRPAPFSTTISGDGGTVTVEELIDLEQQVDFFMVLGQDDAAIELLSTRLGQRDAASGLPYLKLMELYQRRGDRTAFERVGARFAEQFRARAPSWTDDLNEGAGLEAHPSLIERLEAAWPDPDGSMSLLQDLLSKHQEYSGDLGLPAYRDLLMLYAVARDRSEHELGGGGIDVLLPLDDGPSADMMATQVWQSPPGAPSRRTGNTSMVDLDLSLVEEDPPRQPRLR